MQKKKDTRQSGIAKIRSKGKNDTMFSFPERSIFGRAFGELDGCAENGTNEDRNDGADIGEVGRSGVDDIETPASCIFRGSVPCGVSLRLLFRSTADVRQKYYVMRRQQKQECDGDRSRVGIFYSTVIVVEFVCSFRT
jgi:hypothetical protein